MMNLSIDKTTLLAIIIPMVALLLVGYISYEDTIQLIQKDTVDDRINLIVLRLEHLISTITDAETGQRGYIITNRLGYLEPYHTAVSDIHSQLGNLYMMIANEQDNQQSSLNQLNILKGLIEAKSYTESIPASLSLLIMYGFMPKSSRRNLTVWDILSLYNLPDSCYNTKLTVRTGRGHVR